MKQNFKLTTALLVLTMTLANFNLAMGQNMSRWIDLTVQQGEQIQIDLKADVAETPVKVESGTYSNTFTVGTNWTSFQNYTAQAATMRVYGDITGFNCSWNRANVTGLDVSHNTALKEL